MPFDPYPPVTAGGGIPPASIDDIAAIAKQRMSQNTVASAVTPSKPLNPASFGTKTMQTTYGAKPKGKDSGSHFLGIGSDHGFWGTLGHRVAGALGDTLHVANMPHAVVVSAIKEGMDAAFDMNDHSTASWHDFTTQAFGEKQIGFGNIVEAADTGHDTPLWAKRALGFVGDVATDPLTYLTGGAAGIAEGGIKVAVKAGGRREIAAAVRTAAIDAGVHESAAVSEFIVQAGQKGRGAFTKAALEKSALTAAERDALGITNATLKTSIFGANIPGSRIVADAGAQLKGELKAALGGGKFAQGNIAAKATADFFRRGSENGTLDAVRAVRSQATSTAEKIMAVDFLTAQRLVPQEVNRWSRETLQFMSESGLAKHLSEIPLADRAAATHAFEAGIMGSADSQLLKDTMHAIRDDAVAQGLNMGKIDNYLPHVITEDARKLGKKSKEVRELISRLTDPASFTKARTNLDNIAEQNAEFAAKYGAKLKLLEDDPAYLVQHYVDSVGRALEKQKKIDFLVERGHSIPMAEKSVAFSYKDFKSTRDAYRGFQTARKVGQREQAKLLEAEIVLHNKVDDLVRDSLSEHRNGITAQLTQTNNEIADLARTAKNAESKAATQAAHEATAQLKVDELQKVYRTTRLGEARVKVGKQLEQAKKDLVAATRGSERAAKNAKDVLEGKTPTGGQPYKDYKVKGFQEEAERLSTLAKGHTDNIKSLDAKIAEIKARRVPTGLDLPSEKALVAAKETVAKYSAAKSARLSEATLAKDAHDIALAGKNASQPMVDQALTDVRLAMKTRFKAGVGLKTNTGKAEALTRAQDSLIMARDILANVPDHTHEQLIASLDATIATIDAKAVIKGYTIDSAKASMEAFNDPKFFYYMEKTTTKGFKQISDTEQMPEFLLNMAEGIHKLREPGVAEYYNKAMDVWKMYATGSRPSFAVRNLISSTTNMLLEAGPKSIGSLQDYFVFHKMYLKNPTKYMEEATAKFGAMKAGMLDSARDVAETAGVGMSGLEIKTGLKVGELPEGKLHKFNPLSRDAVYVKPINWMNRNVEEIVRGAHAYDVLNRGAGAEQALAVTEKWHFNYSDLSSFDKQMKKVNPFWTFYSKNLELQATTWPSTLKKLNYTYFNAQRNLALGQTPDTNVPDYIQQKMGFQLGNGGNGDTRYYTPDIAPLGALQDVSNFFTGRTLGNLGPVPSMVINNLAGKRVDINMPFSDSKVVEQNRILGLPPIAALTNAVGLTDTGGTSGKTLVSPRTKYNMTTPLPMLSGLNQMTGGQGGWGVANWFGLSTVANTPRSRKAVQFEREKSIANDKARVDAIRKG